MKRMLVIFAVMFLQGCGDSSKGAKDAKGETPVKYVICGLGESNCFVAARFDNLSACEGHKEFAEMLCDSQTDPTKMTCTKDTKPSTAVVYCTF